MNMMKFCFKSQRVCMGEECMAFTTELDGGGCIFVIAIKEWLAPPKLPIRVQKALDARAKNGSDNSTKIS